jgi:hypothetical protein
MTTAPEDAVKGNHASGASGTEDRDLPVLVRGRSESRSDPAGDWKPQALLT